MDFLWIIPALIFSIFAGFIPLIAEFFKIRVLSLLFWERFLGMFLFLPVLLVIPPPADPVFYIATLAASLIFAYADLIYIGLSAKSGAGVTTRIEPLSNWLLFFFWALITPSILFDYFANPVQAAGLFIAMTACVYFALRLRRCEISWYTLKRGLPLLVLMVFGITASKTAVDHAELHSGVFYYVLVQSVIMSVIFAALLRLRSLPGVRDLDVFSPTFTWRNVKIGLLAAVTLTLGMVAKYYAISLVDNPAYATIFGLLTPIWIVLFYRAIGRREKTDWIAGLGIVASTALLVFFTRL